MTSLFPRQQRVSHKQQISTMAALMNRNAVHRAASVRPSFARTSLRPMMMAKAIAGPVNDETFDELVLKSSVPVLVDFWAPWCGPCRMIAPIVDDLAGEYDAKLKCVKLNTDESPQVGIRCLSRSIQCGFGETR